MKINLSPEREEENASEKDEDGSRPKRRRGAAEPASKAVAKKKAKARAKPSTGPKHPEDASVLKFPGTKKFTAKHYGNFTIYIDVSTKCFRLKKAPGTTDLEHFYFKAQSGAKAWADMVKRLKQFWYNMKSRRTASIQLKDLKDIRNHYH